MNTRAPCPQRAYNMMGNIVIVIPPGEAMTYAKRILKTGNVDYKLFSNLV